MNLRLGIVIALVALIAAIQVLPQVDLQDTVECTAIVAMSGSHTSGSGASQQHRAEAPAQHGPTVASLTSTRSGSSQNDESPRVRAGTFALRC
jgi:hypothetical protein